MHFTGLSSPKLVEVAGILGNLHGLWIDQEHSAIPHAQLELMLMACRAVGLDAFARVPPTDYATIMRPMEAGCSGVMIAQLRTLDEVRETVSWTKYPPFGVRGMFAGTIEAR
jgi:2-keto-3-deoxy-L-rhamnonate aldolase RhmA